MRENRRRSRQEFSGPNERYLAGLKHDLSSMLEKALELDFNAVQITIELPVDRVINPGLVLPGDSIVRASFASGVPDVPAREMSVRRTVGRNGGWTIESASPELLPQEQQAALEALQQFRHGE